MEITVNQAVTAHQQGKLEEAERLYRSILENQPTNLIVTRLSFAHEAHREDTRRQAAADRG